MSISSMIESDSPQQIRASAPSHPYFPSSAPPNATYAAVRNSLSEISPPHPQRDVDHRARQERYMPEDYSRRNLSTPQESYMGPAGSPPMSHFPPAERARPDRYPPSQGVPVNQEPSTSSAYHHPYDSHYQQPPRPNSQPAHPITRASFDQGPPYAASMAGEHHQTMPRYEFNGGEGLGDHSSTPAEPRRFYTDRERAEGLSHDQRNAYSRPGSFRPGSPSQPNPHVFRGPGEIHTSSHGQTGNGTPSPHERQRQPYRSRTPPPWAGRGSAASPTAEMATAAYLSPSGSHSHPGQYLARTGSPQPWQYREPHGPRPTLMTTEINPTNGDRDGQQASEPSYVTPFAAAHQVGPQDVADLRDKGSVDSHQVQNHPSRSLLVVHHESGRKGGRNSPLPQAVQGAQSQLSGPAAEPGIKSEFGRMFSGIGSGVGGARASSTPVVNGEMTQAIHDPALRRDMIQDAPAPSEVPAGPAAAATGTGSRGAKRSRKGRDERGRMDVDGGDGRATPGARSPRGSKRNRHDHSHDHHHHHQLAHQ